MAFIAPLSSAPSSTQDSIEAGFGEAHRRERSGAIELALQEHELGVEDLALGDDAGAIAFAHDTTRLG
jgi:hypothetical protein